MVNATPTAPDAESRGAQAAVVAYLAVTFRKITGGAGSLPIKSMEVRASLLSLHSFSKDVDQCHPPIVHVLNREYKREIFSVPTCQFGDVNQFSIMMDD